MSVVNGQVADQNTFNNAFVSKTDTSGNEVSGIINLNNSSDSESGSQISNLQQAVNNSSVNVSTELVIADGSDITLDETKGEHIVPCRGSGGAITLSSTPFGSSGNWVNGTKVVIIGTSDSDSVGLSFNDADYGAILNGDKTLARFETVTLVYVSSLLRWIETGANS